MTIMSLEGQTKTGYRAVVLGVDTHNDIHVAVVLTTLGVRLAARDCPATMAGYRDMVRGKSDVVDAEAAARAVLAGDATALPKTADGPVEAMRILKTAKDSAVKARVQAINQLKAVLVGADPTLRETLATLSTTQLVSRCAELDTGAHDLLGGNLQTDQGPDGTFRVHARLPRAAWGVGA